ncbi:uncharacterized protein I303_101368 [Kwoniella dejecticola CBS 10117]|uniref:DNA repair protein RAD5 n=1 Tax=Kwoniella dejecticola CBS 10117 TaxID=1296121 RepID=A0A1A6AHL0_9TREE|nr:uncharacterized protein I303_01377 [Kwoniella dejecticola CBS 10117]OBR89549.1 hypothetical protein I303_01377 [Kwoniella dejecticola CBS 10117]
MEGYQLHQNRPPQPQYQQPVQYQPRHAVIDMTSPPPSASPTPLPRNENRPDELPSYIRPRPLPTNGHTMSNNHHSRPLVPSSTTNQLRDPLDFDNFGSSLPPKLSKGSKPSSSSRNGQAISGGQSASGHLYRKVMDPNYHPKHSTPKSYHSYIKPATPNAFEVRPIAQPKQIFTKPTHTQAQTQIHGNDQWPVWVQKGHANPVLVHNKPVPPPVTKHKLPAEEDDTPREEFNIDAVPISAEDYERYNGDADKHMQELLSGAIGDGEDEMGDEGAQEGHDIIEGFADGIKLMPHQVRGVRWMRGRESGRKYGGILADDMGLGKTVQALARIVEGKATPAEKRSGFKAGTLIIAPLAVMEQWATEAKTKTKPGVLKVTTHHGPSRTKSGKTLEKFDVIITTFQTVASEFGMYETAAQTRLEELDSDSDVDTGRKGAGKAKKAKKAACPLFDVKWLRVVVDEAQNIKNKNTRAAKAAVALKAKYRWCLTGTPIQNNVEELYSLFKFLRAKPLDDWDNFRDRISSLIKDGRTKLAMKRLHVILKAIMLRRTKDATIDGKKILNLPGRTVQVTPCEFDADERAFYDALEKKTALTFSRFVKSGTATANYTSVLTMLLRLRQACVHPSLVTKSLITDSDALSGEAQSQPKEEEKTDQADELADLLGGLGVAGGKTCQMCFVKLQEQASTHCEACADIVRQAESKATDDSGLPPDSAKIRMLLKLLAEVDERSGRKEKTIVFSQFTSFLDLIEPFLKRDGVNYVRYDGAMRNDKRQESLERIKNHPETRVILISFKAGSTGLNLTCCNNVVLMDLWWNPALEDQAFDRAHRLGQKRDVNIFKLTIEETVEDRILALQNNKRELASAALSGQGAKGVMKLTMNDIMKLFQRTRHDPDDEDSDSD